MRVSTTQSDGGPKPQPSKSARKAGPPVPGLAARPALEAVARGWGRGKDGVESRGRRLVGVVQSEVGGSVVVDVNLVSAAARDDVVSVGVDDLGFGWHRQCKRAHSGGACRQRIGVQKALSRFGEIGKRCLITGRAVHWILLCGLDVVVRCDR